MRALSSTRRGSRAYLAVAFVLVLGAPLWAACSSEDDGSTPADHDSGAPNRGDTGVGDTGPGNGGGDGGADTGGSDSGDGDAADGEAGTSSSVMVSGGYHTCVRKPSSVVCWGENYYEQLGDGTATDHSTPEPVNGLTDAVGLALGLYHTCAAKASGHVVCWGDNAFGQLGVGAAITHSAEPTEVTGLTDVAEVGAGGVHTCARKNDRTVVCWGDKPGNDSLGSPTPVEVTGLNDAVELAVGGEHACARREKGKVACWGANHYGQLGEGTKDDHLTLVEVSGLDDAVELTAGLRHTCARRAGGDIMCWGRFEWDTITLSSFPEKITGLSNVVQLSAGDTHTCVRQGSGAARCWGRNGSRELGTGSTEIVPPTHEAVKDLSDLVEIRAGSATTCATRASGTVLCWGFNAEGQLGIGTTTGAEVLDSRVVPTPLPVVGLP